jgi:hypothetical protein
LEKKSISTNGIFLKYSQIRKKIKIKKKNQQTCIGSGILELHSFFAFIEI